MMAAIPQLHTCTTHMASHEFPFISVPSFRGEYAITVPLILVKRPFVLWHLLDRSDKHRFRIQISESKRFLTLQVRTDCSP